jgi:hypothetical protein
VHGVDLKHEATLGLEGRWLLPDLDARLADEGGAVLRITRCAQAEPTMLRERAPFAVARRI